MSTFPKEGAVKVLSIVFLCATVLCALSFGQKVKVGYDKSVDFSKYKTYTWAEPAMPPLHPNLYAIVVQSVDSELDSKGLKRVEKGGDLTLVPAGGIDFGIAASGGTPAVFSSTGPPPSINSTMWTGAEGGGQLMGAVPSGTLQLQFVDPAAKQIVWSGTVSEKLDLEQKQKSLELIDKGIMKLLKKFPPKGPASKG
jgi:hypothetical protein